MMDRSRTAARVPKPAYLRLRNRYIALFLVLGGLLCVGEVSRQFSSRANAECMGVVDAIRVQCGQLHQLQNHLMNVAGEADAVERARLAASIPWRIDQLSESHRAFEEMVNACRAVPESVRRTIAQATQSSDWLAERSRSLQSIESAREAIGRVAEYNGQMLAAAQGTIDRTRKGVSDHASLSLMIFLILLAVVIFEALFLILPTTRSIRRQWEDSMRSGAEARRLSDKFDELIESTSRIQGLRDDGDGTKIVIGPGVSGAETVFDLQELRKVRSSLRLFEAAVANSRDGILIVEPGAAARVVYANAAIAELTGLDHDGLMGVDPLTIRVDTNGARSAERLRGAFAGGESVRVEQRWDLEDGEERWVEIDASPVFFEDGKATHWVMVYRDVTSRVEYEAALSASVERFELVGRVALDGIYDLDLRNRVCWRNEPLVRDFGMPQSGQDLFDWLLGRIHPDESAEVIADFRAFAASDRSSWEREYRQLKTDGTWARVRDRAMLLRDSEGRPARLIGSLQDITLEREQAWSLQQSESRLRDIINDQTELVCRYTKDCVLTFVNHAYARFFGKSPEELVGTSFLDLIPEEDREGARTAHHFITIENPILEYSHRVILPDGGYRWQRWVDRAVRNSEGEVVEYQAVGRDVTEEILAKRELEQAHERYQAFVRNSIEAIYRFEMHPPVDATLSADEQARQIYDRAVLEEANDAFSRMYGRERGEDSIGLTLGDLFGTAEEDVRQNLEQVRLFIEGGHYISNLETYEYTSDGSRIVLSNSTVGTVEGGKLLRIWGTQRDITQIRNTETQLKQINTMLELFIEHAPAAVAMFDSQVRYLAASRRWMSDYGLEGTDVIGRSHYEVFANIRQEWRDIHQRCLDGETVARDEDYLITDGGDTIWIRWEVRPWRSPEGEVGGIMMFTEDITERKRNEDRLREVNAQQTRLLAELDHRVKNALGGLLALIEMGTSEVEHVGEYAANIARRVRSMASVHGMLSESSWRPLSLVEIIKNIVPGDTPGTLEYEGPNLRIPASQATPLAMVLQELVSNSMKYGALSSEGGLASVRWSTGGTSDRETELTLVWSEEGGPPVPAERPASGVGTQLIQGFARFELRGSIDLDFSRPEGVHHTLKCRINMRDDADGLSTARKQITD